MADVRIATWNVNSIRSRIDRVVAWLERNEVDAIAIQETKAREDQFPFDRFEALGYEVAHHGLNQWNGVAIASRVGLSDVQVGFDDHARLGEPRTPTEARAIGAVCGGVRLWSLYIPNGRSLEDPHLAYKLEWLAALEGRRPRWLAATRPPRSRCSATGTSRRPTPTSGASPTIDEQVRAPPPPSAPRSRPSSTPGSPTSCAPTRPSPAPTPTGTTPSCASPRRQGMRIDFALCSPALAERVVGAAIDREERKGKGASDHAPVVVEIAD